jgi:hypothetical protein
VHKYSDGVVLDLADLGEGWVFGRALSEEQRWCVRAFEHAGEQEFPIDLSKAKTKKDNGGL